MKFSVYGGTGFIGKNYCSLYPNKVQIIDRDIHEPENNNILYLISTIHNYNVFDKPHLDIDTNLTVLIKTLEACREKYNNDFVFNFISSWFVYGQIDNLPATENTPCNPKGFYSITKRCAEQLLISYCETYDIKYRIMRLCNVYGLNDKKASKKRNSLQYLTQCVLENKDIKLYNGGSDIRDFMHVEDVCRAINKLMLKSELNKIYNVSSGKLNNFLDMMSYVKNKVNSTSRLTSVKPPHFHKVVQVKDMWLDNSELKKLGFEEKYNILDGLEMLIEGWKQTKNEQ